MSTTKLIRVILVVLGVLILCGQQVAAFTTNDFYCATEGDFGGTCFYDPSTACSTPSSPAISFGAGTLPSYIKQPYNSIFTAAAAKYNINPAALVGIFYAEQYGVSSAVSTFKSHTMPTPPPPYGDGVPWASSGPAGAQGPFQFERPTWASEGVDASGHGGAPDITDLADSTFSAAHYLSDGDLGIKITISSTQAQFDTAAVAYNGSSVKIAYGQQAAIIYQMVEADESGASGAPAPTTPSTPSSACPTTAASVSPDCTSATGNAVILCQAEQYSGIYYLSGGGHGYDNFIKQCPASALPSAASSSTASEPGPCATDCSGLVSVAVDGAFGQTFSWDVAGIETSSDWQSIPIASVQPGDVVTVGSDTHVEIVDHYDSSSGTLYTFGSHTTGQTTSEVPSTITSYWTGAYRYTGPGSS